MKKALQSPVEILTVRREHMNQEIRERTKWFMDARFGMFIHWGLYSIPACGEWVMSEREMTAEEYRDRKSVV